MSKRRSQAPLLPLCFLNLLSNLPKSLGKLETVPGPVCHPLVAPRTSDTNHPRGVAPSSGVGSSSLYSPLVPTLISGFVITAYYVTVYYYYHV